MDEINYKVARFWQVIDRLAAYDRKVAAADAYYGSGRCGGCETCGDAPSVDVQELHLAVSELNDLLADTQFVEWMTGFTPTWPTTERGIALEKFIQAGKQTLTLPQAEKGG